MKITSVELIRLSMEMAEPYQVAYNTFTRAENILIRITAGGIDGWGCIAPDPDVTGEDLLEIHGTAETILPGLLKGEDAMRRAFILNRLRKQTPGLFSLHSGVDIALWDLLGKKAGLPVWKILGGYREKIKTSVTIGICGVPDTIKQADAFLREGWQILKIKGGLNVETDIIRLHELRGKYGQKLRIRFDANQGYSQEEALYFVEKTRELQVELLEQPTRKSRPDLLGIVTRGSAIPIMADESLVSLVDAFHLVKHGLVDLMNIKLMKTGGITEAVQVDAVARAAGVEVMVGCMDEAALGVAAGLHFALSRKNIRFADLDGHFGLKGDPSAGLIASRNGYLYPSNNPGFGWAGL